MLHLHALTALENLFANLQEDIDLKDYEVTLTCSCTIANNREYQQIPSMVKKNNKLDTCLELRYTVSIGTFGQMLQCLRLF